MMKRKPLKRETNQSPEFNKTTGQKKNTFNLQMRYKSMDLTINNSLNGFQIDRFKMLERNYSVNSL